MLAREVPCVALSLLLLVLCVCVWAEEDFQQWSVQTYEDDAHTLTCNDSLYPVFLNQDDRLTWRRHGHDSHIVDDDHFELSSVSGIPNMGLTIKRVTEETEGIYFCEIRSLTGDYVGRVVKGINIGGRKYHDAMDKYRRKIITGVIAGASVLVLVLGVCAVDHFRYQSDEERREKREAKEERVRRLRELKNGGHDNPALEMAPSGYGGAKNGLDRAEDFSNGLQNEVNTQL